jgi:hypothetical protein
MYMLEVEGDRNHKTGRYHSIPHPQESAVSPSIHPMFIVSMGGKKEEILQLKTEGSRERKRASDTRRAASSSFRVKMGMSIHF